MHERSILDRWNKFKQEIMDILIEINKFDKVENFTDDKIIIKTKDNKEYTLRIGEIYPDI